jgi:hypothetical protein
VQAQSSSGPGLSASSSSGTGVNATSGRDGTAVLSSRLRCGAITARINHRIATLTMTITLKDAIMENEGRGTQRHHLPQGAEQDARPMLVVENYESDAAFEYGAALLRGHGYRISQKHAGQQPGTSWQVTYSPVENAPSPKASSGRTAQQRSDFTRLLRRYTQLTWATSATEQRERASLHQPLITLYLALNPGTTYSQFDDFDMVVRSSGRR